MKTELTAMFGIDLPIVAAPMFLVSDVNMVVATAEAGGLGCFPALNFRPVSTYEEAILSIKERTARAFGINVIVQKSNTHREEQIDLAIKHEVALVITSLGNPKSAIKKASGSKTKIFCDVVNVEHAKKVVDLGADGLIAVGTGAGGHAGDISLLALLPELVKLGKPVIAAGAIGDGRGLVAALALGACGAYMGTRFIASKESPASEEYKQAILQARSQDIVNTDRVDGFPGNFILTKRLEELGIREGIVESIVKRSRPLSRYLAMARAARALFLSQGKVSYKTIFSAGQGVGNISEVLSIAEIIEKTTREYSECLAGLPLVEQG